MRALRPCPGECCCFLLALPRGLRKPGGSIGVMAAMTYPSAPLGCAAAEPKAPLTLVSVSLSDFSFRSMGADTHLYLVELYLGAGAHLYCDVLGLVVVVSPWRPRVVVLLRLDLLLPGLAFYLRAST